MKHLYTAFMLFFIFIGNAQFYKAKISLVNGQINEGYAELPNNGAFFYKSISYKESTDTKKSIEIKNDDIASITYYTDQGYEYIFERRSIRRIYKAFGKYYDKTKKSKTWLLINFSSPFITFYWASNSYSIDKKGIMTSRSSDSTTWGEILLLFKRPGEEAPAEMSTLTSMVILNKENMFRKAAIYYFENEPELVKRIEAKEFETEEIIKLVHAYIALKEKEISQK